MKQSKKVFIHTISCLRRRIDAKKVSIYLSENNFELVNTPKESDYIILFTCGFHNEIIDRCLNAIKKFKKYNAELIVAGCLPNIAKDKLESIFDGTTIPTNNLDKIDEKFKDNRIKFREIKSVFSPWNNYSIFINSSLIINLKEKVLKKQKFIVKVYDYFKDNVSLKIPLLNQIYAEKKFEEKYYSGCTLLISKGCTNNCSYCAIKKGIGGLKSKAIDQCLKEFNEALKLGYKQFTLEADDIGVYGLDIGSTLIRLLDEITKIEGDYTIRLGVTHPRLIIKYITELEKILKRKKIKSIVLSIQSANDRILKIMRRSYNQDEVRHLIFRLKTAYPDLEIGAQFIVGFPSETSEEFSETYNLVKEMHFDYGGIFKYSDIEGTDSAEIEPKVKENVKRNRMKSVLKLLEKTNDYVWDSGRAVNFFNK